MVAPAGSELGNLPGLASSRCEMPSHTGQVGQENLTPAETRLAPPDRRHGPISRQKLVYCNYVLCHVLCDDGASATQRAVREMARVVATGGHVIAVEPRLRSPERPEALDFTQFFECTGLRHVPSPPRASDPQGPAPIYRYTKPPT